MQLNTQEITGKKRMKSHVCLFFETDAVDKDNINDGWRYRYRYRYGHSYRLYNTYYQKEASVLKARTRVRNGPRVGGGSGANETPTTSERG